MQSSINKSNSIGNALFDVAVQLSVPTVISTGSLSPKTRAYTSIDDASTLSPYSPLRKSRSTISALVIPVPKLSDLRSTTNNFLTIPVDKNNNAKIASKSADHLSGPKFPSYAIPPHQHRRSIKKAFLGLWTGLNHDDVTSNLLEAKATEERPKKVIHFVSDVNRCVPFIFSSICPVGGLFPKSSLHF